MWPAMLPALHDRVGSGQTRKALYLIAKLQVDDCTVNQWLARRALQVAHLMRTFDVVQTLWALAALNMGWFFSGEKVPAPS